MQLLADWVTVTVWPPTVMVPVRELPVPLGATLKLNDPSPDMPPLVIVIQAAVLVGVHAQLDPVTTEMLLLSPADDADTVVGETLYVHWASAARTSSPHHEAKSSANVTPARRSVIHTFLLNLEVHLFPVETMCRELHTAGRGAMAASSCMSAI
jgi:hypothetical protein